MTDNYLHNLSQPTSKRFHSQLVFGSIAFTIVFVLQAYFFDSRHRPDEWKALDAFGQFLTKGELSQGNEITIRIALATVCVFIISLLRIAKLIDRKTLVIALIWPLVPFLFSKIYWEFYVFPLALIRLDRSVWFDAFVLIFLIIIFLVTKESNLILLSVFRGILMAQKSGLKILAPILLITFAFLIDISFQSGVAQRIPLVGDEFRRFSYTRDIANPDYSIVETLIVFITSFHFFTTHVAAWQIDLVFSLLIILYASAFCREQLKTTKFLYYALAFFSVLLAATFITHAFQNARYYLFFIPIIAVVFSWKDIPFLAFLGIAHVGTKAIEVAILAS